MGHTHSFSVEGSFYLSSSYCSKNKSNEYCLGCKKYIELYKKHRFETVYKQEKFYFGNCKKNYKYEEN